MISFVYVGFTIGFIFGFFITHRKTIAGFTTASIFVLLLVVPAILNFSSNAAGTGAFIAASGASMIALSLGPPSAGYLSGRIANFLWGKKSNRVAQNILIWFSLAISFLWPAIWITTHEITMEVKREKSRIKAADKKSQMEFEQQRFQKLQNREYEMSLAGNIIKLRPNKSHSVGTMASKKRTVIAQYRGLDDSDLERLLNRTKSANGNIGIELLVVDIDYMTRQKLEQNNPNTDELILYFSPQKTRIKYIYRPILSSVHQRQSEIVPIRRIGNLDLLQEQDKDYGDGFIREFRIDANAPFGGVIFECRTNLEINAQNSCIIDAPISDTIGATISMSSRNEVLEAEVLKALESANDYWEAISTSPRQ